MLCEICDNGGIYTMEDLGDKIAYFRKSKGMSVQKLANNLCDDSTIYRLEKGTQLPRLEILNDICLKLEIPFKALFPYNEDVEKYKKMCRDFTYIGDYLSLEVALDECELILLEITSTYSSLEFRKFIDWHRAILLHKKENKIKEALALLGSLITLNKCVSELDVCIANSMGVIHLSNKNNETAHRIYKKIYPIIKKQRVTEDFTLFPRVGYNYANTLYKFEKYLDALEIVEDVLHYLEVNHLKYTLGEVYHLIGIINKKLVYLDDAEIAFENAILVFTLTNDENNLERTKKDLKSLRNES